MPAAITGVANRTPGRLPALSAFHAIETHLLAAAGLPEGLHGTGTVGVRVIVPRGITMSVLVRTGAKLQRNSSEIPAKLQ